MYLLDEFTALVNALEAEQIDYATCGGIAMAIHGFVRATTDIDIVINEKDLGRAFVVARSRGYDIEGLPLNFKDEDVKIRRISKIDKTTKDLITLDLLLVTDAMADVWAGRQLVEWDSGHAWVVSREGLIKMKRLAGRDIDIVDISRLENPDDES
jgi:hypothetical protein